MTLLGINTPDGLTLSDLIPEWHLRAACRGADHTIFFPKPGHGTHVNTQRAKAICQACPVRVECHDYAVENYLTYGIWGGLSERDRRRDRKEQGLGRVNQHG